MCHEWVPLSPKEKARRIRDTISIYPEGHLERKKWEEVASILEKAIDDVHTQ